VGGLSPSTVFHDAAPTRDGYGAGLLLAGDRDPAIVALDCDLAESTRAKWFGDKFPNRFFQMGISEQDMVATAAGLASSGFSPFASSFAIFLERAFEQVRNAVARPNLNVKVVGSHGGIMTGEDGASAQAICDIAIYRALPNMRVVVPSDAIEAREATLALAGSPGPAYLRLTRSKVPLLHGEGSPAFRLGKAETLRDGTDVTIVATGALVAAAVQAADALRGHGLRARVVNMATIKPLDEEAIVSSRAGSGEPWRRSSPRARRLACTAWACPIGSRKVGRPPSSTRRTGCPVRTSRPPPKRLRSAPDLAPSASPFLRLRARSDPALTWVRKRARAAGPLRSQGERTRDGSSGPRQPSGRRGQGTPPPSS
jgi:transketolase